MPSVVTRATDWLADWSAAGGADDRGVSPDTATSAAEQLAQIAFLVARLDRSEDLWRPASRDLGGLGDQLRAVPSHLAFLEPSTTVGLWFGLSAFAEFHGAGPLARFLIDRLAARLELATPTDLGVRDGSDHAAEVAELQAVCSCRRGRIARVAGDLDDATLHYREALRLARPLVRRDAWPNAQLGLANVDVAHGNYPAVQRRLTALLRNREDVAPMHRTSAYQTLANARRKRGDLTGALLDSWHAFDLLAADDPRRDEVVVSMAETAIELGDAAGAYHAFSSILHHPLALRVRIAAATGALKAVVRAADAETERDVGRELGALTVAHIDNGVAMTASRVLDDAATRVELLLSSAAAPRERAYMLLTLGDAAILRGDLGRAGELAAQASRLADQHAFHDYQFAADALASRARAGAATRAASPAAVGATAPSARRSTARGAAESALSRLRTLATR